MKCLSLIFASIVAIASNHAVSAEELADFSLIDHRGDFHQLSRYGYKKAVVLYVYGEECEVSSKALPKLQALRQKYQDEGVEFLLLNATAGVERETIAEHLSAMAEPIPVLLDGSQLVARSLGLTRTGEVLLIDPSRMQVLYRGALDASSTRAYGSEGTVDRNYLEEALSASLLEVSRIEGVAWSQGQPIQYQEGLQQIPSYADEVVPILERRCVSCHQLGGIAPWAMDSYQMVSGWSQMMSETLMTMRMPPGQIDPKFLDDFVDVHYISDSERMALVNWARAGAPNDSDSDPLAAPKEPKQEWALGEPDLVVEFPTQQIPATGVLDYRYVPVEIGLDEDKWVGAYEFKIGNPNSLHHVVAYTQDEKQQKQNQSGGGSRTNFGGYAPGRERVVFDEGTGILLEEEMRFVVQFHYQTIGRELSDTSKIGLYFRDSKPERPLIRTAVMNGEFVIPAGEDSFPVKAVAPVPNDSYLYNIAPHMHYRGKSVKYTAEFPDGSSREILSIPNFQHSWQMTYRLKSPMFLPAGTTIVAEGVFDNSPGNALNPDPTQEVRWGDQVWDEMFIAWMRVGDAN
ncbi:MAG: redoxin domain-containing protein [Pseudohongiellaceae bacterium]|nr:redoxin domain-containing protein [Pseudohongiellaceae bacterium]